MRELKAGFLGGRFRLQTPLKEKKRRKLRIRKKKPTAVFICIFCILKGYAWEALDGIPSVYRSRIFQFNVWLVNTLISFIATLMNVRSIITIRIHKMCSCKRAHHFFSSSFTHDLRGMMRSLILLISWLVRPLLLMSVDAYKVVFQCPPSFYHSWLVRPLILMSGDAHQVVF